MSKDHFQRLSRFYDRQNFKVGKLKNRRAVKKEKIADIEAEIQIQEFYEEGKGWDDIDFCDGCNLECNFCKLF